MKVDEVFTPGKFPTHTYVERESDDFETELEFGLSADEIVSISGPSKSGKSVLVQSVVDEANLIEIRGTEIKSVGDLWNDVLDELNAPDSRESASSESREDTRTIRSEISTRIPGIGGKVGGEESATFSEGKEQTEIRTRKGLKEVVSRATDHDVVFIDDFHYIDREVQEEIAQSLKEALWRGLSICLASVPYRSDDLERANSDLRGRVRHLKMDYWDVDELKRIAVKGFKALNVAIPEKMIEILSLEAAGSPHLMQKLCLESCMEKGIAEHRSKKRKISIEYDALRSVFNKTARNTNHGSTFEILDSGPKVRGKKRTEYKFEGNAGDVYRCLLRAIAADPPQLKFRYEQLKSRTEAQCIDGTAPRGRSITETCKQMGDILDEHFPEEKYIDWDPKGEILAIPDPYLLFYLRWSDKLEIDTSSDYQQKLAGKGI